MVARMAKPCRSCGQLYPGDCFRDGCKDRGCGCDGCMVYFDEWLRSNGCKKCGVWASDRSCDCDVGEKE